MQTTRKASLWRVLAGIVTSALFASAAVVAVSVPAQAASGTATLTWGIKSSFVTYVTGSIAKGSIAATGSGVTGTYPYTWSGGSSTVDADAGSGTVSYSDGIHFTGHDGALDLTISNPEITLTSSTTATLSADVVSKAYPSGAVSTYTQLDIVTVTLGTPTISGSTATYTDAATALTADATSLFLDLYAAGTAMDSITFSVPYTAPATTTTTTLSVDPAGTAVEGSSVGLTATVSPAASGSVEFFDGSTSLGTAAVSSGTASLSTSALTAGAHSLTAVFKPADQAAYTGSTSDAVSYTITAAPVITGDSTSTSVTVSAADSPALLGDEVTLSATVSNTTGTSVPTGSVEFFSIAAGTTDRVSVGTAEVVDGAASLLTDQLAAGGHTFAAVYSPSDSAFEGSEGVTTANYGIVDPSAPEAYEPGASAVVSDESASAMWAWSAYASGWTKVASGDVSVVDGEFQLTDGVVTADAGGAVIQFTGTLRVEAYTSFFPSNGQWVELVDPALHITADGDGVWVAGVNSGVGDYVENADAERLVVATFSGVDNVGAGTSGSRTVSFDYEGTTALGTWNASYGNAWSNQFILAVPSSIQAFYYQSGTSAANLTKPPADLTIDFAWPQAAATETTTTVSVSAADSPALVGDEVTLSATVSPAAAGTVEFFSIAAGTTDRESIGTAEVVNGVATLTTAELAAGGHTFAAVFTSSDSGYADSEGVTTANYGIVDPSAVEVEAPTEGEHISGVTASWAWSAYASGWTKAASGDVSVVDGVFQLTGGTGIVGDDATVVNFTGTLRVEAYASFFPTNGQWVELVDPTLTIGSDGTVTWTADVRSGVGDYDATAATTRVVVATATGASVPDFSADAVNATISFDYEGTTALGTWNASYANAWSNQFILAVPSSIRAFYYQSGTSAANLTKPPADLTLSWTAPEQSASVTNSGSSVEQGGVLTVDGAGFRDGEVVTATVSGAEIATATADGSGAVSFAWTVPADTAVGDHVVTLTGDRGGEASATFSVTAASAGTDDPDEVSGATLEWGVKQSFRTYITGLIANGSIATSEVSVNSSGEFLWSNGSGTYSSTTGTGEVSYPGSVHFTGHDGALDITLSNPRIVVTGATTAELYLDVVSKGYDGSADVSQTGVRFATLTLPAGVLSDDAESITWTDAAAALTAEGAAAFAGFYTEGTALDPVTFTFPNSSSSVTPVVSASTGTVAPGDTIVFTGTGLDAYESVDAEVHSSIVALGTYTVVDGGVTISWQVPTDFEAGTHQFVLLDSTGAQIASTAFTVTAVDGTTGGSDGTLGSTDGTSTATAAAVCTANSVSGATISWGFKQSFVDYINGSIANGSISGGWGTGSGAYSVDNQSGSVRYNGSIHYYGHSGVLDITLSNLRIQVTGASSAVLYVTTSATGEIALANLSLPTASLTSGSISWSNASATITSAGSALFSYNGNAFYPAGTVLDSVSFSFPLGAEVACDSTTDGTLAATGGSDASGVLWLGLAMMVLGVGAVALRRRRAARA